MVVEIHTYMWIVAKKVFKIYVIWFLMTRRPKRNKKYDFSGFITAIIFK